MLVEDIGYEEMASHVKRPLEGSRLLEVANPVAAEGVLVMFVGDGGKLDIADKQFKITATNFLVTVHELDTCFVTPPEGAVLIKQALTSSPTVSIEEFDDGFPALTTNGCDATGPHGYLGLEPKVVKKISKWIKKVKTHR